MNGKVIDDPISSDYCRKYHYDSNNRPVIVEEYSVFLGIFEISEVYLYHDEYTEKLLFSSGILERLLVFDNVFANTTRCFSFSSFRDAGQIVEEYIYEGNILKQINVGRMDGNYKEIFFYEKDKLIMINDIYPSGS